MKIAVVGCGALGSFYGARLAHGGQDVHFLLRSDYEQVRRHGLRLVSPWGNLTLHPACGRSPEEIGPVDLVVVGLKTTANREFPRLLPPLLGAQTLVLTLQNGLGNEEALARLVPEERVLGGLCFVCLNRVAPGVVHHLAHGLVVLGEFRRPPRERTEALADLFRAGGVTCQVTDDLARAHWEKLVWNIPFNGLGVAAAAGYEPVARGDWRANSSPGACLPTDQLLADPRWEQLLRELMLEVIASAQGLGHRIPVEVADRQLERTRNMGAYKASTLIDFERGHPLELQGLFLEPLRLAQTAGVPTPRLAALARVLQQLDAARATRP